MVLYHVVSTYQLLCSIVHQLCIEDKAKIVISKDIEDRFPDYQKRFCVFFDEFILYDNSFANNILFSQDEVNKEEFCDYFENKLSAINFKEIDNIYCFCTHAAFGVYLSIKKYRYTFCEDAAGALSHTLGIRKHIIQTNRLRDEVLTQYALYDGTSTLVKRRLYNEKANPEIKKKESDLNFDIAYELENISSDKRNKVVNSFLDKKIDIPENSILVLTEHLYNLGVMTWKEQGLMYQLLKDYFLEKMNLVFKTHPDDLFYYSKIFPNDKVIRNKFPAELLPYIFSTKPSMLVTISSTAFHGLCGLFDRKLIFNQEFSYFKHEFYDLHKYYIALRYAEIYMKKGYKLKIHGVNMKIIENFAMFSYFSYICNYNDIKSLDDYKEKDEKIIIVADHIENYGLEYVDTLLSMGKENIVLFINSDGNYPFYDIRRKEIWNFIYPVEINKILLRHDNIFSDDDTELIYIYRKEQRNKLVKIEKNLLASGIKIKAEEYTDEKLRIMVLEGMLRATEDRLKFYMKKCEEEGLS